MLIACFFFLFVCWSPLACLQGAGISWLLLYIVWCLHLGPLSVLQWSIETMFKSVVYHLNEAFRAKTKKKNQHENITMCNLTTLNWDVLRNMLLLHFSVISNGSPGPLAVQKRHEIDLSLKAVQIWKENTVIHRQFAEIKYTLLIFWTFSPGVSSSF